MRKPPVTSWLLGLAIAVPLYVYGGTQEPPQDAATAMAVPDDGSVTLETKILEPAAGDPDPNPVAQGTLDGRFLPFVAHGSHFLSGSHWFRLAPPGPVSPGESEVVVARSGLDQPVELWARQAGKAVRLALTSTIPRFGGAEDKEFALPAGLDAGRPLYAKVTRTGRAVTDLQFSASTLHYVLQGAAAHAWIIDVTFGALLAMGLSALLIRFVLKDQIYPLYGMVFLLQALYLAYFSGQGFTWPVLSWARPFANYAYNVPIAVRTTKATASQPKAL